MIGNIRSTHPEWLRPPRGSLTVMARTKQTKRKKKNQGIGGKVNVMVLINKLIISVIQRGRKKGKLMIKNKMATVIL